MSKLVGVYGQCDRYRTSSTGRTGLEAKNFFSRIGRHYIGRSQFLWAVKARLVDINPAHRITVDVHAIMPGERYAKSFVPVKIRNYIGHSITTLKENSGHFLAKKTAIKLVFFKISKFVCFYRQKRCKYEMRTFNYFTKTTFFAREYTSYRRCPRISTAAAHIYLYKKEYTYSNGWITGWLAWI